MLRCVSAAGQHKALEMQVSLGLRALRYQSCGIKSVFVVHCQPIQQASSPGGSVIPGSLNSQGSAEQPNLITKSQRRWARTSWMFDPVSRPALTVVATSALQEAGDTQRPSSGKTSRPESPENVPRRKKKKGKLTPTTELRRRIIESVAEHDAVAGWEAYQSRGDIQLAPDQFSNLLYLFTGQATWQESLRVPIANHPYLEPPTIAPVHLEWAQKLLADMDTALIAQDKRESEIQLVGRARLHALQGDSQAAFDVAEKCAEETPMEVRLRTYVPALAAFVKEGNSEGAMAVHRRVQALSVHESFIDETEAEYQLILQAVCATGSYSHLNQVLNDMSVGLQELSTATLRVLQNYFESERSKEYLMTEPVNSLGATSWECSWLDVDPKGDGYSDWARGKLREISLTEKDWEEFATGLRTMAEKRESQGGAFLEFIQWIEDHPQDILLDGANIALFRQNFSDGAFSWKQVQDVFEETQRRNPGKKVCVVIHIGRYHAYPSRAPLAQAFIQELEENNQLYVTPRGSNDDWYWLYGVVQRGAAGMLVSNDEMRDHIFALMRPKFFLRWKAHHQFKYHFEPNNSAAIVRPPQYTTCVQQMPESRTWMFPLSEDKWLSIRPNLPCDSTTDTEGDLEKPSTCDQTD